MSEEKKVGEPGTLIVGNYEIAMALTQQRTIKISGYIYNGETNHDVDLRLDGAQDALDRQFIRADLVNKQARVDMLTEAIVNTQKEFEALVELKKTLAESGRPLPSTQKQKIANFDHSVRGFQAEIVSLQAAIKAGKVKINGALVA